LNAIPSLLILRLLFSAVATALKKQPTIRRLGIAFKNLKLIARHSGNQYVSEGLSKGLSTGFRWLGRGIGVYNARDLYQQYSNGEMGVPQFAIEQAVNGYATFGPGGSYIGIGWELGRAISKTDWYQTLRELCVSHSI